MYPSVKIVGSGNLCQRPMDELVKALAAFGVRATTHASLNFPMYLSGLLTPGTASIMALHSSQTLSGLLMALPQLSGDSALTVPGLVSRPYIDMTLETLAAFGIHISHKQDYSSFHIPGGQRYMPQIYTVEGDWSNAAYWLVVGAIGGRMTVDGLRKDSRQADRAILEALKMAGAKCQWDGSRLTVMRDDQLQAFRFDASDCPDLFPPLVLLAAFCKGVSCIAGVQRLYFKESNRAEALLSMLQTLGVRILLQNDSLIVGDIAGNAELHGGRVSSFNDHRIAMAAACAGLFTSEPVLIDDMHCIRKSYPDFTRDMAYIVNMMQRHEQLIIRKKQNWLAKEERSRQKHRERSKNDYQQKQEKLAQEKQQKQEKS
jgi:3-phosphoshikimate 1-carboxyvinyltransferase